MKDDALKVKFICTYEKAPKETKTSVYDLRSRKDKSRPVKIEVVDGVEVGGDYANKLLAGLHSKYLGNGNVVFIGDVYE